MIGFTGGSAQQQIRELALSREGQVSAEIGGAQDCRRRRVGPPTRMLSLWSNQSGAVAIIVGIVATVVIAIVGLGVDVVGWYRTDRSLQNAADAAAIAAATNGTSTYQDEAKAVAAQYGLVDGTGGV